MKIFKYMLVLLTLALSNSYISASFIMYKKIQQQPYISLEGYSSCIEQAKNFKLDEEFMHMMYKDQAINEFTSVNMEFQGLSDDYMIITVRDREQRLCGFIKYHRISPDELLLDLIIVHADYRRLGLASYMVKILEIYYATLGVKELILVVAEHNNAAIKCYEKLGFCY